MKTPYSTTVITYPNGAQQIVKPKMQTFQGNWDVLADAIAGAYFPVNQKVRYVLK